MSNLYQNTKNGPNFGIIPPKMVQILVFGIEKWKKSCIYNLYLKYNIFVMNIERQLKPLIQSELDMNKIIILYWARQVWKTTLAKDLFSWKDYLYLNWDEFDVQQIFSEITKSNIESIIMKKDYIIIDEAQRIKNIGLILKIMYDYHPEKKIIATGSSSFDLANVVNEPLTWRKFEYNLFPFSINELKNTYNFIELSSRIKQFMVTWMYPEVVTSQNPNVLHRLANSFLYKDILTFDRVKKSDAIMKLLQSLAFQIGNEISYNELWEQCWLNPKTVEQYIEILEQSFIIFRLNPYTLNQRTGIKKLKKIYFRDLWIRNAVINNLNPITLRNDIWWLWENFAIVELIKNMKNKWERNNYYFWRDGKSEVDLIVSENWKLHGYEFKYSKEKWKNLKYIQEKIKLDSYNVVNNNNLFEFLQ